MTHRYARAASTALLLVGAVLLSPAGSVALAQTAPPPGIGIRLLEAPTKRADDPRARVYIVDRVAPGAEFTRRIEVSNGDDEPIDVKLYSASGSIAAGSFTVQDAGVPGEIVDWATVTPASVRLAPRSRATASVTFRVDPKAPEGEYYGGIVAERPASADGTGVTVALRAAVRVYLSVGPGGEPASDFTVDTITAARDADGAPTVLAQVTNTGGRALDLSGKLQLSDGPGGLSAGPFDVTLGTTLGLTQSTPVRVALDKALPAGPWNATLTLKSGTLARSATAVITFPEQGAAEPVPAQLVDNGGPPWPLIGAGVAGLAGLGALLLFVLKRRGRRDEGKTAT